MGRGNKGFKVIKKQLADGDVFGSFNELLGLSEGSADYNIIFDKYQEYRKTIFEILKHFNDFRKFFFKNKNMKKLEDEFENFTKNTIYGLADTPAISLQNYAKKHKKVIFGITDTDNEFKKDFYNKYNLLRDSPIINNFIIICANLKPIVKFIEDENNLSYKFIFRSEMQSFKPFRPHINMDFVYMLQLEKVEDVKVTILKFLHNINILTHKIYEMKTSPDIDTNVLVDFIMENIDNIQGKDPGLARCKNAFKRLRGATDLLRGNIDKYYKNFAASKNPSSMLEEFVLDVAEESSGDSSGLIREFKYILKFIKSKLKNNNDPKINSLLSHIDQSFSILEKNYNDISPLDPDDIDVNIENPDLLLDNDNITSNNNNDDITSNNNNDNITYNNNDNITSNNNNVNIDDE